MSKHTNNLDGLSKTIAGNAVVEGGAATLTDETYYKTLPKGLTQEQVEAVRQHDSNYINATANAFLGMAKDLAANNEDADILTMEFGMGQGMRGHHGAMLDDGVWSAYTKVEQDLDGDDLLHKCHNDMVDALNNL